MKISVIIPAYNEERFIERCIESILRSGGDHLLEIIVVDNASTDTTAAVAAKFPEVRVVREEKKGLTRARERGFKEARGDILSYVDADSHVPRDWLTRVHAEFRKDARAVCVSGPFYYDEIPASYNALVWIYWNMLALPVFWILRYMATGTNLSVRRDALETIGGFDTSISFYGEDTNIAKRMSAAGKVKFIPSLTVHTSGRRVKKEGLFGMTIVYLVNFFSQVFSGRSRTVTYQDIRD